MEFNDQVKQDFDRDGFVLLKGYLSPAEAAEINSNIDRFIEEVLPGAPDTTAFYEDKADPSSIKRLQNMAELDPYFDGLFGSYGFAELAGFCSRTTCFPRIPSGSTSRPGWATSPRPTRTASISCWNPTRP